jgi:regulator of nucleoside diphosphate kinase
MSTTSTLERTLTQLDYVRITRLLCATEGRGHSGAEAMQDLLSASDLVASPMVPPTVVTMYTQVLLQDQAGGAPSKLTLVYPGDAEPAAGFISVLSPVGMGLLGLRVGDVATWSLPDGRARSARIVSVLFQPEASGDYTT